MTRVTKSDTQWLTTREKGSALGIRFLIFMITVGGRRFIRLFMWPVALYYVCVHGRVRRALREYYKKLSGEDVSFWKLFAHIRRFANVAADRFFLVKGRFKLFKFTETGKQNLENLAKNRTGAILLGGHLGSFEAMRALSRDCDLPVNIVGYFGNARAFNSALEKYDPSCNVKLIEIDPDGVAFVFKIQQCIDRGELVAILGDRVGLSGQTVKVNFLGTPARFSAGIYGMASVLRCPVYFTAGLYSEPNRYDLHCELFAERIVLPRKTRRQATAEYAQRFADYLEKFCRAAPDNWFNFYDFWADAPEQTAKDTVKEAA